MRIVYLHQYFVTPQMVGGTRSFEMATRLVRAGHEVHVITSQQDEARVGRGWRVTDEQGVTVHWTPVPYNNRMTVSRRLRAFVDFAVRATTRAVQLRGDVVFATSTPLTIALPALASSALGRVPFVFEVRDLWPEVPIAIGALTNPIGIRLARGLERVTYRRARHIVALAPGMREAIIATGTPPQKVSVIPNGCDDPLSNPDSAGLRARHSWLGDRPLVVFAGTLGKVNGVGYLAHLAAEVRKRDPEVRFAVIGDGAERVSIEERARSLGVLDQTFFMLGAIPKSAVRPWLCAADFTFALFTGPRIVWKDAVQNKFFDALAAGTAVAMNFHGWQTDLALDAGVGVVTSAEDYALAADQLLLKMHDHAWLAGVPERAAQLARGPFSRDTLAAQLDDVLRSAVSGR